MIILTYAYSDRFNRGISFVLSKLRTVTAVEIEMTTVSGASQFVGDGVIVGVNVPARTFA